MPVERTLADELQSIFTQIRHHSPEINSIYTAVRWETHKLRQTRNDLMTRETWDAPNLEDRRELDDAILCQEVQLQRLFVQMMRAAPESLVERYFDLMAAQATDTHSRINHRESIQDENGLVSGRRRYLRRFTDMTWAEIDRSRR